LLIVYILNTVQVINDLLANSKKYLSALFAEVIPLGSHRMVKTHEISWHKTLKETKIILVIH